MGRPPIEFNIGPPKTRPEKNREAIQELQRAVAEISEYRLDRIFRNVKTKTAAYTMDPELDRVILVDASGGPVTITLPDAAEADYTEYVIVAIDTNAGGNAVTVDTVAGNINGGGSVSTTTQYGSFRTVSDGANYFRTDID